MFRRSGKGVHINDRSTFYKLFPVPFKSTCHKRYTFDGSGMGGTSTPALPLAIPVLAAEVNVPQRWHSPKYVLDRPPVVEGVGDGDAEAL